MSSTPSFPLAFRAITALSRTQLRLELASASSALTTEVWQATQWRLELVGGLGQHPIVLSVQHTGPNLLLLTAHPQLSPGARYRIHAPHTASEPPAVDTVDAVTIPSSLTEGYPSEPQTGRLAVASFLAPLARQLQRLGGTVASRLALPYQPGDTRLIVSSTLDFPDAGQVWVGTTRFRYRARTTGSFEGVEPEHLLTTTLSAGTRVVWDESSFRPHDMPEQLPPHSAQPGPNGFRGDMYLEL